MAPVKMIAIDLDDTLLHDDISLSDYTKDILRKVMERNIRIVIATGRMFQAARPWGQAIGLGDVPLICYTGAFVGLCESGRVLRDVTMDSRKRHEGYYRYRPMERGMVHACLY